MKVAVIGVGNNGLDKVKVLSGSPHVDGVVVHDVNPERAAAVAAEYGATVEPDLATILRDPQIALVAVSTPNDAHAAPTIAALEAGKAVLCEKPMATTLADSVAMVEAAERTGGFLQIGFELRYSRLYTTVKEWIDAGLLGDVVNSCCTYVTSEYLGRKSWRADPAVCGDMFSEKLSHYVDVPRWWLGGEVADVYSVSAPNIVPYFGIPDNYHTIYRFADGRVSELSFMMGPASAISEDPLLVKHGRPEAGDGHELRYIVYGTRGVAQTEVYGRRITRWELGETEAGMTGRIVEDISWDVSRDHEHYHNTRDETLDVVRRVAEGLPPAIDPRDALATTRLCFGAAQSVETGEIVRLTD